MPNLDAPSDTAIKPLLLLINAACLAKNSGLPRMRICIFHALFFNFKLRKFYKCVVLTRVFLTANHGANSAEHLIVFGFPVLWAYHCDIRGCSNHRRFILSLNKKLRFPCFRGLSLHWMKVLRGYSCFRDVNQTKIADQSARRILNEIRWCKQSAIFVPQTNRVVYLWERSFIYKFC